MAKQQAPVKVVRLGINSLHPEARKEALRLAQKDPSRIEVISPTEAIVRNG